MNSFIVFAACLAVASAGLVSVAPLARTTVVEGPSGRIVASDNAGVAAVGYSAPAVAYSAPAVAYSAPAVAYSAPAVAYSAYSTPYAYSGYGYAAPVVGKTLVASPLTASGYPLLAAGSGLEGQWIPDITEKFYDDGSYKGEIY